MDLAERLGRIPANQGMGKDGALWIHGASNGELTAARPVLDAIRRDAPHLTIVLTCNTLSARLMARRWSLKQVDVRLAPLDFRMCLSAFLRRSQPRALIVVENELWPNRLTMLERRRCPVALLGARISTRSAKRWRYARTLLSRLYGSVVCVIPQDDASGERLVELGVRPGALASPVSLKSLVALPPPEPRALAVASPEFVRAETILAASTHAGEEAMILEAFARSLTTRPELKLILAPRHPVRGDEVAALIEKTGLGFARRSVGQEPGKTPVYLADTLGEMPLWYSLSGLCFVGGSLVPKGGHTPYEPAQFGCAILHGLYLENAAAAYAALTSAGASHEVSDVLTLSEAFVSLDAAQQARMASAAQAALPQASAEPVARVLLDRLGLMPNAPVDSFSPHGTDGARARFEHGL